VGITGRPIATYKLKQAIIFGDFSIPLFELPAPKEGAIIKSSYDHIEIVVGRDSFKTLTLDFPDLSWETKCQHLEMNPDVALKLNAGTVKFHPTSLADVIAEEQKYLAPDTNIIRR